MIRKTICIQNKTGLHLRAASLLCKTASTFQSKITFEHKKGVSDAKSILSILGGCVNRDDEITLICEGEDEGEAMEALLRLIEENFGD